MTVRHLLNAAGHALSQRETEPGQAKGVSVIEIRMSVFRLPPGEA
jgi:hypothetical protein